MNFVCTPPLSSHYPRHSYNLHIPCHVLLALPGSGIFADVLPLPGEAAVMLRTHGPAAGWTGKRSSQASFTTRAGSAGRIPVECGYTPSRVVQPGRTAIFGVVNEGSNPSPGAH